MGMIGKVARTGVGLADYLPLVDTVPNNQRPLRAITSPNAYKREQAKTAPSLNAFGRNNYKQAQMQKMQQHSPKLNYAAIPERREHLKAQIQGAHSKPSLRPYILSNRSSNTQSGIEESEDGFFDTLGDAITGKRYGKADMNVFERILSGPQTVAAARNRAYQQDALQQQRLQAAQEAEYYGLSGLAAESYINDKSKFFDEYNENIGFNEITAGNTYGNTLDGYQSAPKLTNNGNQFYTQDANGADLTADFGQTYDEQNAANKNTITQQNNLATQSLKNFANQTGRMNANTARFAAADPTPKLHELYDKQTGQPYKAVYNRQTGGFERIGGTKAPSGTNLTVGPDGTVTYGTGSASNSAPTAYLSRSDAKAVESARETALGMDSLNSYLNAAEALLDGGYETGATAGIKGQGARFLNSVSPFGEEEASQFEQLDAISKKIGIEGLRAMGGNDTERELLTSIQTTVSPTKTNAANRAILHNQKLAAAIMSERADFMTDWIRRTGSLSNADSGGRGYQQAWRDYQSRRFAEEKQELPGEVQTPSSRASMQPSSTLPPGFVED